MTEEKHHNAHPDLDELIHYQMDQLSPIEANKLERHLLDCSLCSEALDGLKERSQTLSNEVNNLKSRVSQRSRKASNYRIYGIAAAIALLIVSTFLIIENQNQSILPSQTELALENSSTQSQSEDIETKSKDIILPKSEVKEENIRAEEHSSSQGLSYDEVGSSAKTIDANGSGTEKPVERKPEIALLQSKATEDKVEVVTPESPRSIAEEPERFESNGVSSEELDQAMVARTRSTESSKMKKTSPRPTLSTTQTRSIFGNIYAYDDLSPLPGVNVVLKGTTNGAITDLEGNFEMTIPPGEQTLIVNFIGYLPLEYIIGNTDTLEIALDTEVTALSEIAILEDAEEVNDKIKNQPKPGIGRKAYRKYLEESLKYPKSAIENGIEGKVILNVSFNEFGIIKNIEVRKGLGYGCDEEAVRLIQEGPQWEPGKIEGQPVDMELIVRIKFNLEE